jgi:hypothetical protein
METRAGVTVMVAGVTIVAEGVTAGTAGATALPLDTGHRTD